MQIVAGRRVVRRRRVNRTADMTRAFRRVRADHTRSVMERTIQGKSAGLRTQTIVGTSSALVLLISKYGSRRRVDREHGCAGPRHVSRPRSVFGRRVFGRRDHHLSASRPPPAVHGHEVYRLDVRRSLSIALFAVVIVAVLVTLAAACLVRCGSVDAWPTKISAADDDVVRSDVLRRYRCETRFPARPRSGRGLMSQSCSGSSSRWWYRCCSTSPAGRRT